MTYLLNNLHAEEQVRDTISQNILNRSNIQKSIFEDLPSSYIVSLKIDSLKQKLKFYIKIKIGIKTILNLESNKKKFNIALHIFQTVKKHRTKDTILKLFHCFRNTFSRKLAGRVEDETLRALNGHLPKSMSQKYAGEVGKVLLVEALQKVEYKNLNFKRLENELKNKWPRKVVKI